MKTLLSLLFVTILYSYGNSQVLNRKLLQISNYDQNVLNDPNIDYKKYKSFSLVSSNKFLRNEKQTFPEKHIEFFLSNFIYMANRLKYISFNDTIKPDILIVYDYSNDYKEKIISPQTYTIPYWKSGENVISTVNSNTYGSANVSGDINLSGNGFATNNTTIITRTPAQWTTRQITKPGYTTGKYFPSITLILYDTSTNEKIWEGTATATSDQKDFRFPGQFIMGNLALAIPRGSYIYDELISNNNGWVGMLFPSYCTDGQNYYPSVYYLINDDTPAAKGGLREGDIIIDVNGVETTNLNYKEVASLFIGDVGTKIKITIEREGRRIKKTIVKTKRPPETIYVL